jgi:hypothetical protein
VKVLSIMTLDAERNEPPAQDEIERMEGLIVEMRSKGVLLDTGGRPGDMLEFKVARKNGRSTVTDGPFAEAKEVVGGYALLEVRDYDDAIAWTNRFLDVIGDGVTCYVREVVSPTV